MEHRGMYDSVDSAYFAQRRLDKVLAALKQSRDVYIPPGVSFERCGWQFEGYSKLLTSCEYPELQEVTRVLFKRVQELQMEVDKREQYVKVGLSNTIDALSLMR